MGSRFKRINSSELLLEVRIFEHPGPKALELQNQILKLQ